MNIKQNSYFVDKNEPSFSFWEKMYLILFYISLSFGQSQVASSIWFSGMHFNLS